MDDIIIKVDTDVLRKVSGNAKEKIQNAKRAFEDMETLIRRTADYWEGQGHDSMQNAYQMRSDDYQRIFMGLEDHVNNLLQIAGVYETGENKITQAAGALPADVIE